MSRSAEMSPPEEEPAMRADEGVEPGILPETGGTEPDPAKALAERRRATLVRLKRSLGEHGVLLMRVGMWYDEHSSAPDAPPGRLSKRTGLTRAEVLFVIQQHWPRVHPRRPWP